jgi:hypothetical protein
LENRVRGWLPKEPTLPSPKRRGPASESSRPPTRIDVTTIPERKLQLGKGIVIGLGIALTLIGLLGWLSASRTYETLKNFFFASGIDPNSYYLFNDLIDLIAIYLTLMTTGIVALILGGFMPKPPRIFYSQGPHAHLGNGLIGGGGGLAFFSLRSFFVYILSLEFFELQSFMVMFSVGVLLIVFGILVLRRKS